MGRFAETEREYLHASECNLYDSYRSMIQVNLDRFKEDAEQGTSIFLLSRGWCGIWVGDLGNSHPRPCANFRIDTCAKRFATEFGEHWLDAGSQASPADEGAATC